MLETYTQEQIESAKAQATFCVVNGHLVPNKCGSILLSALSTAERERDAALAQVVELEARLRIDHVKETLKNEQEKNDA